MAKVVGLPPEFVAFAKTQPFWAAQEKIAHTLAYDGRIMGDYSIPVEKAKDVSQPTIVLAGESSFPFFLQTVAVLGDAIPEGESKTLPGQDTTWPRRSSARSSRSSSPADPRKLPRVLRAPGGHAARGASVSAKPACQSSIRSPFGTGCDSAYDHILRGQSGKERP